MSRNFNWRSKLSNWLDSLAKTFSGKSLRAGFFRGGGNVIALAELGRT